MENYLLSVLQTRMDKCTSEQFWIVSAVTAVNAFVITHRELFNTQSGIPLVIMGYMASVGAAVFVLSRHFLYFKLSDAQTEIMKNASILPSFLREKRTWWHPISLSGVALYLFWVIGGLAVTMLTI